MSGSGSLRVPDAGELFANTPPIPDEEEFSGPADELDDREPRAPTAAEVVEGVAAEFAAQRRRTYRVTVEDADESEEEDDDPSEDEESPTGEDLEENFEDEEDLFYPELTASDYLYEGFMHDLAQIGEQIGCVLDSAACNPTAVLYS